MPPDLSTELLLLIREGVTDLGERVGRVEARLDRSDERAAAAFFAIDEKFRAVDQRLSAAARAFEVVDGRLANMDGRLANVESRLSNVEDGQKLVVDRLDRLLVATTRDRTEQIERLARLEVRVERLESRG